MKPLVFVSHIHEHGNLAKAIKQEISYLLLNGVDFFVSSDRVSLVGGDRSLHEIENALNNAAIVLVVCSRDSVLRPWINFEAGGAWMAKKRVVPLCCGGLRPSELPQPLASRYAYSIADPENLTDLVALIAREAGLDPPEFSAADLVILLANALVAPTADPGDGADKDDLSVYPKTIRLVLKLTPNSFFDAIYDHDAREDARSRVGQEVEDIESRLRAFLAERFGPKNVSLDYSGIKFPLGSIRTKREEALLSEGYESSTWCEVTIEVDGKESSLLEELRNNQALGHAKSKSVGFLYKGSLNLDEFAEDLYDRKVQIKQFGRHELAFGKLDKAGVNVVVMSAGKTVEIRLLGYDFKELDLGTTLAPVFNYLKIGDHLKFLESADDSPSR